MTPSPPKSGEMRDSNCGLSVGRSSSEDLPPALAKMRAGFCTSVSCGPDRRYDVVFSFPSLDAMQAAHREWIDFDAAHREASAGAQPSNEKAVDAFAALLASHQRLAEALSEIADGCMNLRPGHLDYCKNRTKAQIEAIARAALASIPKETT